MPQARVLRGYETGIGQLWVRVLPQLPRRLGQSPCQGVVLICNNLDILRSQIRYALPACSRNWQLDQDLLAMRVRELLRLERRAERTAAALNFIGALASPGARQALIQSLTPKQIQVECRKAVALCVALSRGLSGPKAGRKATAKDHLERLAAGLSRNDSTVVERHAITALRLLGFDIRHRNGRRPLAGRTKSKYRKVAALRGSAGSSQSRKVKQGK